MESKRRHAGGFEWAQCSWEGLIEWVMLRRNGTTPKRKSITQSRRLESMAEEKS